MRLKDRVALVTGGSRGMGQAIALGFAREGADVAVNYVSNAAGAEQTVARIKELGRRAIAVRVDTRVTAEVDAMVAQVIAAFGRIDILVNDAGVLTRAPFMEISEEEYDRVVDTNMKGYFLVGQAVAREMIKQGKGKIINVVSEAQQKALPGLAHYGASKGGAYMLSHGMALDLAPHKINVNIIAPGPTLTDMTRQRMADPANLATTLQRIPWGRVGRPEDVVGAAVYLASDEAENVTGATIAVDGGSTL
ncbi:MAG: 3-oxoacyl-ACP reductase FabG [Dehalococcoidales bacterium]|nr:3-oxoacyl-ACP reductase FabG [Dehalococcoidales bacterium]